MESIKLKIEEMLLSLDHTVTNVEKIAIGIVVKKSSLTLVLTLQILRSTRVKG